MAKNQGRRSLADLSAAALVVALEPSRKLAAAEQKSWDRVVKAWPADHFIASDMELLTQYCAACAAFELARKGRDLASMDRAGRLTLSYATKLRITPQSRYDEKSASTQAGRGKANAPAANRLIGGDEWHTETMN